MTLAELIAEVYTITGRPDRVAETLSAVKSATLKAHQSDYYYKDIFETGVDFGSAEFVQAFAYRDLIPTWRAIKYLRKYDAITNTPGAILKLILPENVLDDYATQKTNICYVAGSYLQINCSEQNQYFLLGCYLNPNITEASYNSWVTLDHPYCVVFDAAATVFKAIGKDEEASAYRTLVAEQLAMLRTSNIIANGF